MNLLFVSNCFLNPFVQNFISPAEVEDNSSLFALLALGGGETLTNPSGTATTIISGKLTDLSSNPLANATLSIFTIISSQTKSLTRIENASSSSTDTNGNFSFAGSSGNLRVKVSDTAGNSLGSFDLIVNSTGDGASSTNSSDAKFILSLLTASPINTTTAATSFTVGGTITGLVWGAASCNTGDSMTLFNTSNSEVILVNAGIVNFSFVTPLTSGSAYNIIIGTSPAFYSCSVTANGSGTIASSDVTNVTIDCGNGCP